MIKEEIWSIPIQRARNFFQGLDDVVAESANVYRLASCRITLTELRPKGMGVWAAKRMHLRLEGDSDDIDAIYHRFFIQFLSTGG